MFLSFSFFEAIFGAAVRKKSEKTWKEKKCYLFITRVTLNVRKVGFKCENQVRKRFVANASFSLFKKKPTKKKTHVCDLALCWSVISCRFSVVCGFIGISKHKLGNSLQRVCKRECVRVAVCVCVCAFFPFWQRCSTMKTTVFIFAANVFNKNLQHPVIYVSPPTTLMPGCRRASKHGLAPASFSQCVLSHKLRIQERQTGKKTKTNLCVAAKFSSGCTDAHGWGGFLFPPSQQSSKKCSVTFMMRWSTHLRVNQSIGNLSNNKHLTKICFF